MTFEVRFSRNAYKEFSSFDRAIQGRIHEKLLTLTSNPLQVGTIKLRGERNTLRLRVGNYRIVYEIFYGQNAIVIHRIDKRSRVYENL